MQKLSRYINRVKVECKVWMTRKYLDLSDVTLLSQNCIGGVMYHDCNDKFLSPTVNLFMLPSDFMRFVNNYEAYLTETPELIMGDNYPIGYLSDNLQINFMHYETTDEALEKWESRKKRINKEKVFIICIERDGFNEENYKEFKSIKYPKALFTIQKKWADDPECIYIPKFKNECQVPDIIPGRYMYYKNKLPKLIKKAFDI